MHEDSKEGDEVVDEKGSLRVRALSHKDELIYSGAIRNPN
jgi:hypothetical protein